MDRLRSLLRSATIPIPPTVYAKNKTPETLAEALRGLLEKHGLNASSGASRTPPNRHPPSLSSPPLPTVLRARSLSTNFAWDGLQRRVLARQPRDPAPRHVPVGYSCRPKIPLSCSQNCSCCRLSPDCQGQGRAPARPRLGRHRCFEHCRGKPSPSDSAPLLQVRQKRACRFPLGDTAGQSRTRGERLSDRCELRLPLRRKHSFLVRMAQSSWWVFGISNLGPGTRPFTSPVFFRAVVRDGRGGWGGSWTCSCSISTTFSALARPFPAGSTPRARPRTRMEVRALPSTQISKSERPRCESGCKLRSRRGRMCSCTSSLKLGRMQSHSPSTRLREETTRSIARKRHSRLHDNRLCLTFARSHPRWATTPPPADSLLSQSASSRASSSDEEPEAESSDGSPLRSGRVQAKDQDETSSLSDSSDDDRGSARVVVRKRATKAAPRQSRPAAKKRRPPTVESESDEEDPGAQLGMADSGLCRGGGRAAA